MMLTIDPKKGLPTPEELQCYVLEVATRIVQLSEGTSPTEQFQEADDAEGRQK